MVERGYQAVLLLWLSTVFPFILNIQKTLFNVFSATNWHLVDAAGWFEGKGTKKWKFCHYPLTPMLMDSQMKVRGPHNISGASQQNSIASFSQTTDVDGKLFQNLKKNNCIKNTLNGS